MSITSIEWTKRPGTIGETWNPTTGCNKVDRGCKNCYAEIMHKRLQAMGQAKYAADFLDGAKPQPDTLNIPLRWKKPRTVFVNSMSDLFHKDVSFDFIARVFQVMEMTQSHTYLILTKRPEIALEFWRWRNANRAYYLISNPGTLASPEWKCPPNVWMGTSVNDQESADKRIPYLLELDGCLLFLSYEPATGPLDLYNIGTNESWSIDALAGIGYADGQTYKMRRLNWVICGGESGPKAVPMDPAWAREVRDDCKAAGVPFFFKQWGQWRPEPLSLDDAPRMVKSKDKGFNVLDREIIQQFPT
jgi:protein gp37